ETQAALPSTGRCNDRNHLSVAMLGAGQRPLEHAHLVVAAYEAREAAGARAIETCTQAPDSFESLGVHRDTGALHLEFPEILEREETFDALRGRGSQIDLADLGEHLHALRQTYRVPLRGVVHAQIVTDLADHNLSRIDTDARRHVEAALAPQLLGEAAQ